jgi:hypothetical protein
LANKIARIDTLRLAPFFSDIEVIPNAVVTAVDEVEAVRVGMNDELDSKVAQNATAVATSKSEQGSLNLEQLRTRKRSPSS